MSSWKTKDWLKAGAIGAVVGGGLAGGFGTDASGNSTYTYGDSLLGKTTSAIGDSSLYKGAFGTGASGDNPATQGYLSKAGDFLGSKAGGQIVGAGLGYLGASEATKANQDMYDQSMKYQATRDARFDADADYARNLAEEQTLGLAQSAAAAKKRQAYQIAAGTATKWM